MTKPNTVEEPTDDMLSRILSRVSVGDDVTSAAPCGSRLFTLGQDLDEREVVCDGMHHYRGPGRPTGFAPCPDVVSRSIRQRVDSEHGRLAGTIMTLSLCGGGLGFDCYDPKRHAWGERVLGAVRRFAIMRPPMGRILMTGSKGVGKTLLQLAGHFACLENGVDSVYLQSSNLRRHLHLSESFDEDARRKGEDAIQRLLMCQVIWFDDIGEIEDDQRKRGQFAAGLKNLLDNSRAAWCVSTNCDGDEAASHADMGAKIVSRLLAGALVLEMKGKDARVASAEVVR